jgi:uncharacterized membrane protein YgcG
MRHTIIATGLALFVTTSAFARQAPAPTLADSRWEPWIGCWQLLDESARGQADAGASARSRKVDADTRVCVAPSGRGVTLTTRVGDHTALEETLIADGSAQPMEDAECRGSKRSEWSVLAPRLYSTADISCNGQATRTISSLSMIMPGPVWIDIQMIDIQGRKNIRIRRLEPADGSVRRAAFAGETRWSVADVKEASAKLAPETVQAALVELGSGFDLKSRHLLDLKKAAVPETTIDLMVALSYPDKFVVDRPESVAPPPPGYGYGYGIFDAYGPLWPFYMDSMFWPSYYSPFAYRYWGMYDPYFLRGSGYVIVQPPGDGEPVESGRGRVVAGHGYTRVTTRTPEPVHGTAGGGAASGPMSNGGSSTSDGGGNSGVSSGGYSSGGGGGGGRTAVPRPPGK